MQTAYAEPGIGPEEHSLARRGLRLVKIRLALTLLAVAILPLAALAPLIRTILDDPRNAQQARLTSESEHVAAEVRRELDGIRLSLEGVAGSPAIAAALSSAADPASAKAAADALGPILLRPSGAVAAIAVVDATGEPGVTAGNAEAGFSHLPPPVPGEPRFRVVPGAEDGAAAVEVAAVLPGAAGAPPSGALVAVVPLDRLLRWGNPELAPEAQQLAVLAANGRPVASVVLDGGESADATFEWTADRSSLASAAAAVPLPGFDGWTIVASAPATVLVLPLPVLVTLAGLIFLLSVFAWWMGRQILAPAAALEAQRAHFQDLYLTAREAALVDSLTGLGNHRAFQEAVERMVDQSRRYGTIFSLVLLDIDEFKRVNDTRGHATGDELLAEVGDLIRAVTRGADSGFRIGGDEFALLLPETAAAGAEVTARRILSRGLADRRGGRYGEPISFSAGVTSCPEFGTTRLELTAQADAALYRGKRGGRTIVSVFDPSQDRGHVDEGMRAELSAAVAAVVESNGLSPVYQPIIHLPTGRVLGFEGLVRVDPSSGFKHTGALFDAAEIAGRVLDLDRAALDVVLRGAARMPVETLLSLNVSPRSFEAPEFNATVFLAILRRHDIDPGRVILELTERDAIRDPDRLRAAIHALQDEGVRIAADDVGAGNAGLRLLSQFRFDVVKIDLSLVQGSGSQDQTLSVITTLVGLARRWGALTIAEGVETAEQLRMIRELGIDAAQGYLLGRPGSFDGPLVLDLEALSGAIAVGTRSPEGRPAAQPAPLPVRLVPAAPPPVPTAASVLAGNAPSVFRSS
jgi:diguanylate cyclase (GGDEF)-like protein